MSVDPGREKCGIAVVHRSRGILYKSIVETAELLAAATALVVKYSLTTAVVGDSTSSRSAQSKLSTIEVKGQKMTVIPVNEYRSTDQARNRYWADHPPKGLFRLIPITMRVPPVPVDDYAAVVLAERYFAGQ
ncbi:pre-16S rRNA-processing nuclease YqgF [Sporomusa aerivorans]|uniref:pre-16S rRNA-processing nuclease YqgF n=1 Tax=Sporomusa aerivorans TaxID=204936 RepID=UPI00352A8E6B